MTTFQARQITRTYTQRILGAPAGVFPLLDPVREAEWLDGWEYEMIYSAAGVGEEGCVFLTRRAGEAETIWTMTRRDAAAGAIEFVMVTPGSRVGHLRIRLEDNYDGTTAAHIAYTFTALGEAGNKFIDDYTEAEFERRMQWWERSLNYFLTTGKLFKADAR